MKRFLGLSRVEISISMWDHSWGENGGVREASGIQCTDDTSDWWDQHCLGAAPPPCKQSTHGL
jgi:hypothetical protein